MLAGSDTVVSSDSIRNLHRGNLSPVIRTARQERLASMLRYCRKAPPEAYSSSSRKLQPSHSDSTSRVCSPSIGGGVDAAGGLSSNRIGLATKRTSPETGCLTV